MGKIPPYSRKVDFLPTLSDVMAMTKPTLQKPSGSSTFLNNRSIAGMSHSVGTWGLHMPTRKWIAPHQTGANKEKAGGFQSNRGVEFLQPDILPTHEMACGFPFEWLCRDSVRHLSRIEGKKGRPVISLISTDNRSDGIMPT